jgi:hypothetical protein
MEIKRRCAIEHGVLHLELLGPTNDDWDGLAVELPDETDDSDIVAVLHAYAQHTKDGRHYDIDSVRLKLSHEMATSLVTALIEMMVDSHTEIL